MKCLACHRLSTWEQQLRWFPFFWKGLGGWTGSRAREEGKRSPGEAGTGTLKKTTAGGGWLAAGALTPTLCGAEDGSACVCAHV